MNTVDRVLSDPASKVRKGGSWLLEDTPPADVFTPEKKSDEHRLMAQTTDEFMSNEVLPNLEKLETKDWQLARTLVRRAGELGLLGTSVPEQYGGLDLDKVSTLIVAEHIARSASFATTYGGHTNLCILPIVLFGTDAQKQKYLPTLVAGEMVGAYALSESGSGSDALAAKTRAVKQADGSWVLNGEKMWITNGGFADVIIVFAQVDGDQFTAFIVEKAFPGVSAGKEEHKMGLHGSSTTPIVLQDAKVPAENVLGEIGKGYKVALNTLNFGRFKLGGMCIGGSRMAIGDSAKYAAQRKQFGHPIASFGAIRHKIGEMTARTYAVESLMYRTAGLIDEALEGTSHTGAEVARAFEEYAVEASIAKVAGTETLDYVLDENIQIHGGNGYVKEYGAERCYRDARVNRIFEGTNEINRLLIPGMLVRRALKGDLPLIAAAKRLQDEILSPSPSTLGASDGALDEELRAVSAFKKVALMVLGTAMQTYGQKLTDEQEVLGYTANIIIDIYAAESAVLRARGALAARHALADLHEAAARAFVSDAAQRIEAAAKSSLAAMAEGDTLRTLLAALRRVLKVAPVNTVALRRQIAEAAISRTGYIFN
ncbi:MAG: acyl-CoA dehydrogenase [Acidobacteria bacterium]|nr:acyl-CoA dehydrogenase [Acidobacteriota bacterium]MSO83911.1 acyl-CoA dehydrogenase [Acidobacteriota bacterium]